MKIFATLFLFCGIICFSAKSISQGNAIVNEVLFSADDESATARDQQIYFSVLNEVFQKKSLTDYSLKPIDDFLLSRLTMKESNLFKLNPSSYNLSDISRKKLYSGYSKAEIDREIETISKSIALIEIKESQLKQKQRFLAWFELIKRKYRVRMKSVESN